ncbi:MAG: hypothetical protein H0X39_05305 [Actinobacteria bacterium]|nr:hypothetical protein [Actinomycetota bacterium]
MVPYLMAPAWFFNNVELAYKISLGQASLAFSLAAFPAYALTRRMGVSAGGGLIVALLALLAPDGAFSTNLLSEPYAYPVFLAMLVVAVDTIANPTRGRQFAVVTLMAVLCLVRIQFIIVPGAYALAALVYSRSPRVAARQQWLVLAMFLLAACISVGIGIRRLAGVYAGITTFRAPPGEMIRWFGVNVFILAVASGWVIVPRAVAGFTTFLRSGTERQRAFTLLTIFLSVGLLGQAALFGANEGRVLERYTFYLAPLIAIAFVHALEAAAPRDRLYRCTAFTGAAVAILVPAGSEIRRGATDESPTILGLQSLAGGGPHATLLWALMLAVAAMLVGPWMNGTRLTVFGAVLILGAVGVTGTRQLLKFGTSLGFELGANITAVPRLNATHGTALLTGPRTNRFLLMQTLFWNPQVTRVIDLGSDGAPDGYASIPVRIGEQGELVDAHGAPVPGPFAFDSDTTAATFKGSGRVFPRLPQVIVFGLNQDDRYLETVSQLYAAANDRPFVVSMWLASPLGAKSLNFACGSHRWTERITTRPRRVQIAVPRASRVACRISLIAGIPVSHRKRTVSVMATRLSIA